MEQEVNLQYAYNSLLQSYADLVKENSYKDAIIATQQEELQESRKEDNTEDTDAD